MNAIIHRALLRRFSGISSLPWNIRAIATCSSFAAELHFRPAEHYQRSTRRRTKLELFGQAQIRRRP
jgi:hypothetical protein